MIITQKKTGLSKTINIWDYNPADLNLIYRFYTNHKGYSITVEE